MRGRTRDQSLRHNDISRCRVSSTAPGLLRLLPVVSETSVDDLVDVGVRPDHSDLRV